MTRPTDPQDPSRTDGAAGEQSAESHTEQRLDDRASDAPNTGAANGGAPHGGAPNGRAGAGTGDTPDTAGDTEAAGGTEAAGSAEGSDGAGTTRTTGSADTGGSGGANGSGEPAATSDRFAEGSAEPVETGDAHPDGSESADAGSSRPAPTDHPSPTAERSAPEAEETGRAASSAFEPPTVALPPPWERATADAGGAAPEPAADPSAESPPSPSSRRPRGWRPGRTDQTDLGTARTVALDPRRPEQAPRPDDTRADPAASVPLRAEPGRPDPPRTDAPPRPPGRGDAPPRPPGRGSSELGRFGLGRPGADPGGEQLDGERSAPGRPGGFGWPRNRRPRQAALQLKRLDPWSVLKIALVLAVVLYLVWLVAVGVLYGVLGGIGVWDRLNGQYADLVTQQSGDQLISAGRVFGVAAVIGAVNSLLFAVALSVGAFIYNVSADLVGGVEVTLSERD